ncbi:MAG: FAD-dependent oxidoreductase [Piscinibacter sp.]|nr:FAD-dependent oxidoreductase [Piscinibacter sp.]
MRRLVLLGGGHAHLQVLRAFAADPLPAAEVLLVTPWERLCYSGMVPGWMAGHYAAHEVSVPLPPFAQAARATLRRAAAVGLDAAARRITLDDGSTLDYDVLSLDIGSVADSDAIPGAAGQALAVRPIEAFAERWERLADGRDAPPRCLVVVGGGAAGTELALAAAYRLGAATHVTLVAGRSGPLVHYPAGVRRRMRQALDRARITVLADRCVAIEPDRVVLAGGARPACDLALLALGGAAPPWLAASGLALDDGGFVSTGPTLQSLSHPEVFAAGDVASRVDAPRPKSGVYALRAGAPLALNLRRALAGGRLEPYTPQRRSLNLLSCGERTAVASWGPFAAAGGWVWRWKDRIDRRFIADHQAPR